MQPAPRRASGGLHELARDSGSGQSPVQGACRRLSPGRRSAPPARRPRGTAGGSAPPAVRRRVAPAHGPPSNVLLQHRPGAVEGAEACRLVMGRRTVRISSRPSRRARIGLAQLGAPSAGPCRRRTPRRDRSRLKRLRNSSPSTRSILLKTISVGFSAGTMSRSTWLTEAIWCSGSSARGVDHVHHQVGVAHLLQGGLEALHQVVRQAADEARRCRSAGSAAARRASTRRVVASRVAKSWSLHVDAGAGEAVHQRRLAGVGVADQGRA